MTGILFACAVSLLSSIQGVPPKADPVLPPLEKPARPSSDSQSENLRRIRASVDRALAYLAARQAEEPDGSFPSGDAKKYAPVGVTALGTLAFLASGNASRGPYSENALRGVDYLLSKCDTSGERTRGYIHADNDAHSKMHGHGYAALALAEAYGMYESRRGKEGAERLREHLKASIRLIESSQGESGGWYHSPIREVQHEGSVTITLVQALRAARNVGIQVDKAVIDRAVAYVRRLQKEDGSFRYDLLSDQSTASLTAAGISTLNATGQYDGPAIDQGIDFLIRKQNRLSLRGDKNAEAFPEYGRLYTAQALYQYRDRSLWEEWFADTRERLLETQKTDGSWSGQTDFGSIYLTAVNCLVLEISFDYLPIFQR